MGILDKLMFWKKDDEFDFDEAAGKELGDLDISKDDSLDFDPKHLGLDEQSPFDEPPTASRQPGIGRPESERPSLTRQPTAPGTQTREIELISSKLDTIKAILGSLDQRMANIEKAAGVEKKEKLW